MQDRGFIKRKSTLLVYFCLAQLATVSLRREALCEGWGREGHHPKLDESWRTSLGTRDGCFPVSLSPRWVSYTALGISLSLTRCAQMVVWTMVKRVWGLKSYHLGLKRMGIYLRATKGRRSQECVTGYGVQGASLGETHLEWAPKPSGQGPLL